MTKSYWSRLAITRVGRRRALLATGTAAAGAAFLAACGGGSSNEVGEAPSGLVTPVVDETKQVKTGGIHKTPVNFEFTTLDPHISGNHVPITPMTYSQLWKVSDGYMATTDGEPQGDVVETWEISPDKLTITAKINSNAHFATQAPVNGRSVDAQDVLFSWQRYRDIGSRRAELVNEVDPNAPVLSLTSPDSRTVVIKLKEPTATILTLFAATATGAYHIVPKEAADPKVLDLRGTQLGSGPWMLSEWSPGSTINYRRNPGYKQDKRTDLPYMDGIDRAIMPEYATQLAQFKAGHIYDMRLVRGEDLLPTKQDHPDLQMIKTEVAPATTRFFFGHNPGSPFRDERVRQAWMYTIDRDLYLDVVYNIPEFTSQGLPVDRVWEAGLQCDAWTGWWLDPKSADFGPNAKYFQKDVAEAKKLLTAAGFPNGIDTTLHFPASGIPTRFYNEYPPLVGMVTESGLFRVGFDPVNYNVDWSPKYRNIKGQFDGVGTWTPNLGTDDPTNQLYSQYNPNGALFQGGDARLEELTNKMIREFDTQKRQALVHDVQRHEASQWFYTRTGGASSFSLTWPVVRNFQVWRRTTQTDLTLFLDPARAPLKQG